MAPDRVLIGGEQTEAGKAAIQVSPHPTCPLWGHILRELNTLYSAGHAVVQAVLCCLIASCKAA